MLVNKFFSFINKSSSNRGNLRTINLDSLVEFYLQKDPAWGNFSAKFSAARMKSRKKEKETGLTAQIEMTGSVVQVGHDRLDIVESHGLEFIVPQIEHVHRWCPGQEIRLESYQFVLAERELLQVPHPVQRFLRDVFDLVLIQLQFRQRGHLDERSITDHGD